MHPLQKLLDNNKTWADKVKKENPSFFSHLAQQQALKHDRLCEINVIEQALNVCKTGIVQNAWARGQTLSVHGWVYRLTDGLLHDMKGYTSSTVEMCQLEESVQQMRA